MPSFIRRLLLLAVIPAAFLATSSPALASGITVTPITWDMIGLASTNGGIPAGPNEFPVGVKVCNTSGGPLTGVQTSFGWDSSNAYISLSTPSSDSIGALAAGACADSYYTAQVTKTSAAWNATRQYTISASSTEGSSGSSPAGRQLYVEKLVSQARNTTLRVSGPGGCDTSGGWSSAAAASWPCDTPASAVRVGSTYTYKLYATTSTAYEQIESFLTFPGSMFRVEAVSTEYQTPAGLNAPAPYADACGWDADPTSPDYASCVGPIPPDFISSSGKAGGNLVVTYTVKVIGTGSGSLNSLIYDFSGSSYHFNSDFGAVGLSVAFTADWPLDVSVTGQGSVSSSPSGINCGAGNTDCVEGYANNTSVTLTATPEPGEQFELAGSSCPGTGWAETSAGSGIFNCVVLMTEAKLAVADFTGTTSYPLTTTVNGTGTLISSPSGINCGDGNTDCAESYASGDSVTLTATPGSGQEFVGWGGACASVGTTSAPYTCTLSMDAAKDASVTFQPIPFTSYTLTVTTPSGGTVASTSTPSQGLQIGCSPDCSVSYEGGTVVELTPTPQPGYRFDSWSGCDSVSGDVCTVNMDADKTVTPNFVAVFDLTAAVTAGTGTITSSPAGIDCDQTSSPDCSETYDTGTAVTLTATPGPGQVYDTGVCPGTGWTPASGGTYTCLVTMTEAKNATVAFRTTQETVIASVTAGTGTITSDPSGIDCSVEVVVAAAGTDCSADYNQGSTVTLTAAPGPGQQFRDGVCPGAGWTALGNGAYTCILTMDAFKSASAAFEAIPTPPTPQFSLQLSVEGSGSISGPGIDCTLTCLTQLDKDAKVTLSAKPADGYKFESGSCPGEGWTAASEGSYTCTVTMDKAKEASARFVKTEPKLELKITSDDKTVKKGDVVTVSLNLQNTGDGEAENTEACMTVPSGFALVKASKGATVKGSVVCWKTGSLDPAAAQKRWVKLRVITSSAKTASFRGAARAANAEGQEVEAKTRTRIKVKKSKPRPRPVTG